MNIHTPIPVQVAAHRGVVNHYITKEYDINTYKASTLIHELPDDTLCVKLNSSNIIDYRFRTKVPQAMNYPRRYQVILAEARNRNIYFTFGQLHDMQQYKMVMDTIMQVSPIIRLLFSFDHSLQQAA